MKIAWCGGPHVPEVERGQSENDVSVWPRTTYMEGTRVSLRRDISHVPESRGVRQHKASKEMLLKDEKLFLTPTQGQI